MAKKQEPKRYELSVWKSKDRLYVSAGEAKKPVQLSTRTKWLIGSAAFVATMIVVACSARAGAREGAAQGAK